MAPVTSIRRVRSAADPALAAAATIYAEAIPAAERKPAAWLAEAAGRPDFAVLVAVLAGRVVGFATVFLPASPAAVPLLEYLAVDAADRGRGVGAVLFQAAVVASVGRPLLVEVDAVGPADAGSTDRSRRQAFYRRLGCRTLAGLHYTLPWPGELPAMDLLAIGTAAAIPRATVAGWVAAVYRDVYGCDDAATRAATVVETAADPVGAE